MGTFLALFSRGWRLTPEETRTFGGAASLVSVPVAFVVMIAVSLRTPPDAPASAEMLALHAPEGLGLRLAEDDLDAPVAPSSVMIER